jgi:ribonucleoside-triphosphate reductase
MENGLYPYTKRYLGTFNNHFSTIGLVGMNEACLNAKWLKKDLRDEEAVKFSIEVLNHMRERLKDYQEKYGDLYNLEATPAESTTYRFAKHDKEKFPNIVTANMNGTPYYTNSSHLPVGTTDDIFNALDVQDELQTLYTSGTVFHTFLGEKLPDWKAAANLVRTIANNYKLPYYTLSPTYSVCKNHGYIAGEVYTCPHCGEPTEVNSRITGYYRPVQNWNDGKAQEFKDRKEYSAKLAATRIEQMGENLFKAETPDTVVEKMNFEREQAAKVAEPAAPVMQAAPTPVAPVAEVVEQATPVAEAVEAPAFNDVFKNSAKPLQNVSTENFYKEEKADVVVEADIAKKEDSLKLFVTKTCPNCKKAEELLDMAGIKYSIVDANENPSDCEKYQIMQAPTLVVNDSTKYVNLSNVIKFVEETTMTV